MIDNSKTKPEECECCGFETAALKPYPETRYRFSREDTSQRETHKWLCLFCASTMAGSADEYPEQFSAGHAGTILKTICFVGNAILARLDELPSDAALRRKEES